MSTFSDLGLAPNLLAAIEELGFESPTPIQLQAIPPLMKGGDVLGLAATGTGKTAAFGLPMLHRLSEAEDQRPAPYALILVPTRELARQAGRALRGFCKGWPCRILEVYGGASIGVQLQALRRGVEIVVATPGRARDLLERGALDLGAIQTVVLDEADEMLDMGFQEDLEALLEATPKERQTALFSATFPKRLKRIANQHMRNPVRIEAEGVGDEGPPQKEMIFLVRRQHKLAALERILELEEPDAALLFCRTRADVDALAAGLDHDGTRAEALHGGLSQQERDRVMQRLRSGAANVVVATDVAARGLDVDRLSHVVNVDVPRKPDLYVHRIGRVGRAGRTGVAITLVEPKERRALANIARFVNRQLPMAQVPTLDDLKAHRRERLRSRVARVASVEDLDAWRTLAQDLADELDMEDIAAAGLRLLAEAEGMLGEEREIPTVEDRRPRDSGRQDSGRQDRGRQDRGRQFNPQEQGGPRGPRGQGPPAPPQGGWVRLYIGLGAQIGVRPRDLVGAITGETGLPGRAIGAIRITPRFSLVEVPASEADRIIEALRGARIRGRAPFVRLDRRP
jgi:ATP-dependent RNA helicase DeaD